MKNTASEFIEWFEGSKVVDEHGRPMLLYHGTGAQFNKFAESQDGAHYFSPDRDVAQWFAENSDRGWQPNYDPRVLSVHLAIRNPLSLTLSQLVDLIGDSDDPTGVDWTSMPNVVDTAMAAGHDGIHLIAIKEYNGSSADQWIAFGSGQVLILNVGRM